MRIGFPTVVGLFLAASIAGSEAPGRGDAFRDGVTNLEQFWNELERHAWDMRLEYHRSPEGKVEYCLTTKFYQSPAVAGTMAVCEVDSNYELVLTRSVARVREALGLPPFAPGTHQRPSLVDEIRTALEARCWSIRTDFYDPPDDTEPNQYRVQAKFFQEGTLGATVITSDESTLLGALCKALGSLP